jgi:hypothetical protein
MDLASFVGSVGYTRGSPKPGIDIRFIAYGTDWLAFAHLMIAIAFWGPIKDPVRNIWVVQFGMLACVGIAPLALICGPIRGIPFYWTCIDLSFGVFGLLPLVMAYRHIRVLQRQQSLLPATSISSPVSGGSGRRPLATEPTPPLRGGR